MLGIRERVKPLSSPERGGASRDGKARAATPAPAGAAPGISDTRVTTSRAWPGGRPLKTTVRATL